MGSEMCIRDRVGTKNEELQDNFNHELHHYPAFLFESVDAIRPVNKLTLADALWRPEAASSDFLERDTIETVLDRS